ncbi:hypothetical protein OHS18_43635 [Amycolatopsis sp. NBC_00355]|uniref:hypothetical protein n=1 Tax=Amycolatopsis sp. NBC_00355 TaxID=2975957 RepID=UPI002E256F3B
MVLLITLTFVTTLVFAGESLAIATAATATLLDAATRFWERQAQNSPGDAVLCAYFGTQRIYRP